MAAETIIDRDAGFIGVEARMDPALLSQGLVSAAKNARFRNGASETRLGLCKAAWANFIDVGSTTDIQSWGTAYGHGRYRDPNGDEWIITATAQGLYALREGQVGIPIEIPTAVSVQEECFFVQAFNILLCFRGNDLPTLQMADLTTGFTDLVPHYNPGSSYVAEDEVAFGAFANLAGVFLSDDGSATVTFSAEHRYRAGFDITLRGSPNARLNNRWNVSAVGALIRSTAAQAAGDYTVTPLSVAALPTTVPANSVLTFGTYSHAQFVTSAAANPGDTQLYGILYNDTLEINSTCLFRSDLCLRLNVRGETLQVLVDGDGNEIVDDEGQAIIVYPWAPTYYAGGTGSQMLEFYAATGTVVAGEDPLVAPSKWRQIRTIMPPAAAATFIANRVVVATGFDLEDGTNQLNIDYIQFSDLLDPVHTWTVGGTTQVVRANQGSDDEIVDLMPLDDSQLLVLKEKSVMLATGVVGDLSGIALSTLLTGYGTTCRGAATRLGDDVAFVSSGRGVCSIKQSVQGIYQGVELPLSAPLDPVISAIDWTRRRSIRSAYWNNRLYVAVPLSSETSDRILTPASETLYDRTWTVRPGQTYRFVRGNTTLEHDGTYYYEDTVFTAVTDTATATGEEVEDFTPAELYEHRPGANAILVYDFLNSQWSGYDVGEAVYPQEFVVATVAGKDQLTFLSQDGYVNLMEWCWDADEVYSATSPQTIGRAGIEFEVTLRGHHEPQQMRQRFVKAQFTIETWAPNYSITALYDGVKEEAEVVTDRTRSRTRYLRPWGAAAYNPTNVNDDAAVPFREDYSVQLQTTSYISLGSGIELTRMQEVDEGWRIPTRQARYCQYRLSNDSGRFRLRQAASVATGTANFRGTRS